MNIKISFAKSLFTTALISAAGLIVEVALTRVLSVLYLQSYVFLVLSVAVLGIGLGAALLIWLPRLRSVSLSLLLGLAALSVLGLSYISALTMGVSRLLIFGITTTVYLLLGIALTQLFIRYTARSTVLYVADLSGAAAGVVLALLSLNALGGLGALSFAALLLAVAALVITPSRLQLALPATLALAGVGLQLVAPLELSMAHLVTPKGIVEPLQSGGELIATHWNAFSRTDLVQHRGRHYLFMDGGAGSLIPDIRQPESWQHDIGGFAFAATLPDTALIIGPGGGLDIALAQQAGVANITAVEINRASVELTRNLTDVSAELYEPPVVTLIDEGRSALKRLAGRYDLIFLSHVITQTADTRTFVMAENTLYTVEAFHQYLAHLTPDGALALKLYDELTLTRAFFTALAVLTAQGLPETQAAQHLIVLLDTRVAPAIPLLMVRQQPLDFDEAVRLARLAEGQGYALLFIPGLLANPPLDGLLSGEASFQELISASSLDLHPVTDNRPFFYKFEPGLPEPLSALFWSFVSVAALLMGGWLLYLRNPAPLQRRLSPIIFGLLGAGFMMLEVNLVQRAQQLLGHPSWTLGLVVGGLLLGSSAGSYLAGKLFGDTLWRGVLVAAILVVCLWTAWSLSWSLLVAALSPQEFTLRASVLVFSILPLALPLGMPFPLMLTAVSRETTSQVASAWAVNGFASVFGSIAAVALALVAGFSVVAAVAGLLYASVAVLVWLVVVQSR
jgi:hypothetical protein